jgi:hypothetical protein
MDGSNHLLDDEELRYSFGPLIGRIAHSHWWGVSRLGVEFQATVGAICWCPTEWVVDPLTIAALLRLSDFAQIDARRAPGFLRAIRKPQGVADLHWNFQQHLHKPHRDGDRLVFTSSRPFEASEAQSWWLCFETIGAIDREVREVDALLADQGRKRFAVRHVAGAEDPLRLARLIWTEGWTPIEARIQASNAHEIVRKLGGEELYGSHPSVTIRELVQNSCDAVRARRAMEQLESTWGEVTVRMVRDGRQACLEVEDDGVGMSLDVLTGPFLDFGNSYWGSELMTRELPGLLSSGFEATGRYGIGFFSVFMVGNRVRVTTRRFDASLKDTNVLEFSKGLDERPLLRPAGPDEMMHRPGTRVKVWLEKDPESPGGLLWNAEEGSSFRLDILVPWLCPAVDVNLAVEDRRGHRMVVQADDWTSLDAGDLLRRISLVTPRHAKVFEEHVNAIAPNVRELRRGQRLLGRVAVSPSFGWGGVVTVGGLRASTLHRIAGVLVGYPTGASRHAALPFAEVGETGPWATLQADLLHGQNHRPEAQQVAASVICACGGDVGNLAVAYASEVGWLSQHQLAQFCAKVCGLRVSNLHRVQVRHLLEDVSLEDDVILMDDADPRLVYSEYPSSSMLLSLFGWWPKNHKLLSDAVGTRIPWNYETFSVRGILLRELAAAWRTDIIGVLKAAKLNSEDMTEVGTSHGRPVTDYGVDVFARKGRKKTVAQKNARSRRPSRGR